MSNSQKRKIGKVEKKERDLQPTFPSPERERANKNIIFLFGLSREPRVLHFLFPKSKVYEK